MPDARYSRHILLSDVGEPGQEALANAAAKLVLPAEPLAELTAGAFLAAGGVGAIAVPGSTDAQRASLAAHGVDTRVSLDGEGRTVSLAPRPAWWPGAEGDHVALAYWRGSIAATAWMTDTIGR